MITKESISLVEPIIEKMVEWIALENQTAPMEALESFYLSQTYQMLIDDELQIWDLSDKGIFDLWKTEQKTGSPRTSQYL